MMASNSYWSFCLFMMSQSPSLASALFWQKILCFWPFIISFLVHFTLVYTENNLLKNRLIYVAIYSPALFFSLADLTTPNVISTTPTLKYWGYQNTLPNNSLLCWADGVWACTFAVLSIVLLAKYHNGLDSKNKRQQVKLVTFALVIPIIFALLTDFMFPFAGINFPGLGALSCSLTAFVVAYGMLKYELFSFKPEIAAEKVFSAMSDSVILVRLDNKIMKVNQSFLNLTGYSEGEVIGKSINELLTATNAALPNENTAPIIEYLQKTREIRNHELIFYTKTNEKRIGTISCSIVSGDHGKDVGAAIILYDVTERRAIEQKLLKAERFASIGELAGMLGHDLRNPLSGIRNANFYLQRKLEGKLDSNEKTMFESIDKNIDYSNKIIKDLLDYASYYSTEVKLDLSPATPKSLLKAARALTDQPQNITLLDETKDSPQFYVDEVKICRSFINFLKNAFDAMPNGGKVRVSSVVEADKVTFTFKDNGCGMTKETIDKLWTPLFTTKAKGMGFGMVICKRNITAHGGQIRLESALGQGTTITVELPLNLKP
jgi:PAS domain S-box-containing protein